MAVEDSPETSCVLELVYSASVVEEIEDIALEVVYGATVLEITVSLEVEVSGAAVVVDSGVAVVCGVVVVS